MFDHVLSSSGLLIKYLLFSLFYYSAHAFSSLSVFNISHQGQESIQFQDVLCQMIDMVNPKNPQRITIEDMIKPNKRMICGTCD